MERVEIRVAPWKMALVIVGIIGFVAAGIWMTATGDLVEKAAGLLGVVFFGGFCGYALLKGARGRPSLALRFFKSLRGLSYATVAVAVASADDASDLTPFLTGSGDVQSVATMLAHFRRTFGSEFLLGWNLRDRGAQEFAEYLEGLRRTHSTQSSV
jgi:hypothetical protein